MRPFSSLLVDIRDFVETQKSYGILKIIYRQAQSEAAIEQFHRRIVATCQAFNVCCPAASDIPSILTLFQVAALLSIGDWQIQHSQAQQQDRESLNARLSALEANQNQLAETLSTFPVPHLTNSTEIPE